MKLLTLAVAGALLASSLASAQSWQNPPSYLETTDQMRQRHEAERYQEYQSRRGRGLHGEPLGGYRDSTPAPYGTQNPTGRPAQDYGYGRSPNYR